jgi:cephalosporin hydroxylase
MLDLIGREQIFRVDIEPASGQPEHPRNTYLTGSSTADDVVEQLEEVVAAHERVLAILDSDHSRDMCSTSFGSTAAA